MSIQQMKSYIDNMKNQMNINKQNFNNAIDEKNTQIYHITETNKLLENDLRNKDDTINELTDKIETYSKLVDQLQEENKKLQEENKKLKDDTQIDILNKNKQSVFIVSR